MARSRNRPGPQLPALDLSLQPPWLQPKTVGNLQVAEPPGDFGQLPPDALPPVWHPIPGFPRDVTVSLGHGRLSIAY
eukprot:650064-Amphidinium_carterae.1